MLGEVEVIQEMRSGICASCTKKPKMADKDELDTATNEVLRQTYFFDEPLLVSRPDLTNTAFPDSSPTATAFEAFHPDIGHITDRLGRRQSLFLRLGKGRLLNKAYEKVKPPPSPASSASPSIHNVHEYRAFSRPAGHLPTKWFNRQEVASREMFMRPLSNPETFVPSVPRETTPLVMSTFTPAAKYEPYRPSTDTGKGKHVPPPILITSVQDTDDASIDFQTPTPEVSPSKTSAPSAGQLSDSSSDISIPSITTTPPTPTPSPEPKSRRFSFDYGAPDDWRFVSAYARSKKQTQAPLEPTYGTGFAESSGDVETSKPSFQKATASWAAVPMPPSPNLVLKSPARPEEPAIDEPASLDSTRFCAVAVPTHGRFTFRRYTP